jgi:hypothetical protein
MKNKETVTLGIYKINKGLTVVLFGSFAASFPWELWYPAAITKYKSTINFRSITI